MGERVNGWMSGWEGGWVTEVSLKSNWTLISMVWMFNTTSMCVCFRMQVGCLMSHYEVAAYPRLQGIALWKRLF